MSYAARRRRTAQEEDSDSREERQTQTQSTQRGRRHAPASEDDEDEDAEEEEEEEEEDGMDVDGAEPNPQDQVVKKLVRYALACEYQRVSIKRAGITEKVIGKQRGTFKRVFEGAQQELRHKFGMQMVPLPVKDKVTMKEKRAAAKSNSQKSNTTTSYVLTSILPPEYKTAAIMPPSIICSPKEEAQYMAVCTVIVSLISLSPGGSVPDSRLRHQLKRLFLDTNTPVGRLEDVLNRMRKEGYVIRVSTRESNGDDESVDWYVGGRGKVEISSKCVRGFVHEVYGESAPEDLEKRLQRSLGLEIRKAGEKNEEEDAEATNRNGNGHANGDPGPSNSNGRGRRRVAAEEQDD